MGNYDLTGLSTGSFENLVQALIVKILGAGSMIFGAGPDGGREATYEGLVNYPSPAEQWNGYIVAQAKFRQRLTDKETDKQWAIEQLRGELQKYAERKSGRRVPDYYIFATNVVLSPVQDIGGKDSLKSVFEEYEKTIPLRGFAIWDFDQIGTYLDAEESIRHAFTAYITPGDVLAEVIKRLGASRPDFTEVMTSYLARELNAAKYADLDQTSTKQILLSRVFVDLPLSDKRLPDPPDETSNSLTEVVATLIEAARERLDRGTLRQLDAEAARARVSRFVLVGGPGQGKTTVGQFACQMFRAAILKDRPRHLLSDEVLDALDEMMEISKREQLELPKARRFPLHIVLRLFASELSKRNNELTLFAYIVERIRQRTSRDLSADDFREWLRAYPWLIVLDGLDEVPSSSNRRNLLQAIEEFWMEAAQLNADVLMVATTRPQDYQDDFSPSYYTHRWLVPLSQKRAISYGKRLVEMRHGIDSDRATELVARLEKAAESEATARLMRTPLQVTIMTTLVEQVGRPPQDKWRLFREYYGAIYRRERERSPSDLLGTYQSDIDAIHYRTGLELQILSGSSGQTDARLTEEQFEQIVRARLIDQGHEGAELERLVKEIIEAAATRLVFIVGLDVNSVGFEIRSLQEFMAAEAIIDGTTEVVQTRLRTIAPASSWRNVFIFASGHCFAEVAESLIDTIHTICREMNSEADAAARAIRAGSRLALELLEDAAVTPKPKHARLLARTALELLELPPGDVHERLGAAHAPAIDSVFREVLDETLGQGLLGPWRTLGVLVESGHDWARQLMEKHWPEQPEEQLRVALALDIENEWIRHRVIRAATRLPVNSQIISEMSANGHWRHEWWLTIASPSAFDGMHFAHADYEQFELSLPSVDSFRQYALPEGVDISLGDTSWLPIFLTAGLELNASTVADLLDQLTAAGPHHYSDVARNLPWPVGAMLLDRTPELQTQRSTRLRKHEFGDRADWLAAEERWRSNGFKMQELAGMSQPWPRDIASCGVPYIVADVWVTSGQPMIDIATHFAQHFATAKDDQLRQFAASALLLIARVAPSPELGAAVGIDLLMEALLEGYTWLSPSIIAIVDDQPEAVCVEFVDRVGRCKIFTDRYNESGRLVSTFAQHSSRGGIARVVTAALGPRTAVECRAYLPQMKVQDFHSRPERIAAATIISVTGQYDPDQLAKTIADEFPEAVLRIADLMQFPYRDVDENLLIALARELPSRETVARAAVTDELVRVVKSKAGPSPDSPLWGELGLL